MSGDEPVGPSFHSTDDEFLARTGFLPPRFGREEEPSVPHAEPAQHTAKRPPKQSTPGKGKRTSKHKAPQPSSDGQPTRPKLTRAERRRQREEEARKNLEPHKSDNVIVYRTSFAVYSLAVLAPLVVIPAVFGLNELISWADGNRRWTSLLLTAFALGGLVMHGAVVVLLAQFRASEDVETGVNNAFMYVAFPVYLVVGTIFGFVFADPNALRD